MGIKLLHRQTEARPTGAEFQDLLNRLAALYSQGIAFKYDEDQGAVTVSKGDRIIGNVRLEGALHTIIWATLSLAEKEA